MIAIVDYGVGNLFSLSASLSHLGLESTITRDKKVIDCANSIILPGVGAFGDAADKLRDTGLFSFLQEQAGQGKPFLGICLGMQLLFDRSYEYGVHEGLGLIPGDICLFTEDLKTGLKVPHIGWNSLKLLREDDPLMKYSKTGDYVYFVHSYYAKFCEESLVAVAEYEVIVPGVVRKNNVWGTQFHPEKSGAAGLNMLRAFGEM